MPLFGWLLLRLGTVPVVETTKRNIVHLLTVYMNDCVRTKVAEEDSVNLEGMGDVTST